MRAPGTSSPGIQLPRLRMMRRRIAVILLRRLWRLLRGLLLLRLLPRLRLMRRTMAVVAATAIAATLALCTPAIRVRFRASHGSTDFSHSGVRASSGPELGPQRLSNQKG